MSFATDSSNGVSVEKSTVIQGNLSREDALSIIREEEAERRKQFWKNLPDWVKIISFVVTVVVTIATFYYGTKSSIDILRLRQEQTRSTISKISDNQREIVKQQRINRELLIEIKTELKHRKPKGR